MLWPCSTTSGSRGRWASQTAPSVNLVMVLLLGTSRQRACCYTSLHHLLVPHTSATSPCLEEAALATTRCVYHHRCCLAGFLHFALCHLTPVILRVELEISQSCGEHTQSTKHELKVLLRATMQVMFISWSFIIGPKWIAYLLIQINSQPLGIHGNKTLYNCKSHIQRQTLGSNI